MTFCIPTKFHDFAHPKTNVSGCIKHCVPFTPKIKPPKFDNNNNLKSYLTLVKPTTEGMRFYISFHLQDQYVFILGLHYSINFGNYDWRFKEVYRYVFGGSFKSVYSAQRMSQYSSINGESSEYIFKVWPENKMYRFAFRSQKLNRLLSRNKRAGWREQKKRLLYHALRGAPPHIRGSIHVSRKNFDSKASIWSENHFWSLKICDADYCFTSFKASRHSSQETCTCSICFAKNVKQKNLCFKVRPHIWHRKAARHRGSHSRGRKTPPCIANCVQRCLGKFTTHRKHYGR